jgi:hypothetical protein
MELFDKPKEEEDKRGAESYLTPWGKKTTMVPFVHHVIPWY